MAFLDTTKDLMQRLKNKQQMTDYLTNKSKLQQPSAEFMDKIGASLPDKMSFKTPMDNALGTQGATVSQSGITDALGKAGTAVGGAFSGLNAANDFANGDYVNGGLNAAKTIATFVPGGQPIAAAIQVGQTLKDMFVPDRSQEALQKSMQAAIESQALAENEVDQTKQGLEQQRQQNLQNMQQQQQQNNETLTKNILGQATGGAAPVSMPTNYAEESMPTLSEADIAEQKANEQAMLSNQPTQQEELKQSLMDRIRSGLNDFSAGYQDNTNTDFAHGDLLNSVTGGAAPVQTSGNTFNLGAAQNKKGIMARLGEAVGTGQRIMANPLTQAAIAGMVSKAAGGDVDDIALAAFKYGTQKANADRYYQQVTGKTNRPFLNTYSAQDVTNKRLEDALIQRQQQYNQTRQDKLDQQKWERENKEAQQKWERDYKTNKDTQDRAIKREEVAARKKYWETRGGNDRGNNVAQQKYEYQQGLNKSIGQFSKYAKALEQAKDKDKGWLTSSNERAEIEKAQQDYDKAREFMINTYGADFIKYAKEQGWE